MGAVWARRAASWLGCSGEFEQAHTQLLEKLSRVRDQQTETLAQQGETLARHGERLTEILDLLGGR